MKRTQQAGGTMNKGTGLREWVGRQYRADPRLRRRVEALVTEMEIEQRHQAWLDRGHPGVPEGAQGRVAARARALPARAGPPLRTAPPSCPATPRSSTTSAWFPPSSATRRPLARRSPPRRPPPPPSPARTRREKPSPRSSNARGRRGCPGGRGRAKATPNRPESAGPGHRRGTLPGSSPSSGS